MKRLFYIVWLVLLPLVVFALPENQTDSPFVLVLDAGHGGGDTGAPGPKKRGDEKDITLAVTLLAGKYIAEKHPDVKVIYTRTKDVFVQLDDRADLANKSRANLFISVHVNASPYSSARGSEVYTFGMHRTDENMEIAKRENSVILLEDNYKTKYEGFDPNSAESYIMFEFMQNKFVEQSLDFATTVRNELKHCVSWRNRGVKQAAFLVLRKSSMPRILIELDFITNPEAETIMLSSNGQKKYARAICDAFSQYKAGYDRKNGAQTATRETAVSETRPAENRVETVARNETPVRQVEKAKSGKVYKVQIMAIPNKLSLNSPRFKGYKVAYYQEKNLYKYTTGETSDIREIARIRKSLLKDFKDAFIVVFENGVKVQTITGNP